MIYAWSADGTDPMDHDSVMYHMSNRGTQGVVFVEDNEVVTDLGNAKSVTFLANDVSCLTSSCINGGICEHFASAEEDLCGRKVLSIWLLLLRKLYSEIRSFSSTMCGNEPLLYHLCA